MDPRRPGLLRRAGTDGSLAVYFVRDAENAGTLARDYRERGDATSAAYWQAEAEADEDKAVAYAVSAFRSIRRYRALAAQDRERFEAAVRKGENPRGRDRSAYAGLRCELGWTGDRCTKRLDHRGPCSNA